MRLRNKITILTLIVLFFIAISTVFTFFISTQVIRSANEERYQQNYKIADAILKGRLELQTFFARDYSLWDDMADAVLANNIEWMQNEFFGPLEIYKANAVWVYDQNYTLLFQKQNLLVEPPFPNQQLSSFQSLEDVETFYQKKGSDLYTYHVAPILYHSKPELNSSPQGFLIIAKKWSLEDFENLETKIDGEVTLVDSQPTNFDNSSSIFITLNDWNNQQTSLMQFVFKDESLKHITEVLGAQLIVGIIIGFVGFLLSVYILQTWVINPTEFVINKLRSATSLLGFSNKKEKLSEFDELSMLVDYSISQAESLKNSNAELFHKTYELKTALENLEQSKGQLKHELEHSKRLSVAIEASNVAVVITDKENKIIYVNTAWEKLNGYTMDEVKGKNPSIVKSGETPSKVYDELWSKIKNHLSFTTESIINKRKDGKTYSARISIFPILDENTIVNYVGIVEDISQRKELDQLKSQFISLASHQLRTPLSALKWQTELLGHQFKDGLNTDQQEILSDISEVSYQMAKLVNDLLNVGRIETGRILVEPERVVPKEIIDNIQTSLSGEIEKKKLEVIVDIESQQTILVDKNLFREVVMNLMTNAIKYTPESGKITLRGVHDGDFFTLSVQDSGIGVPEAEQSKIFSQFFRASNAIKLQKQGTGLGLHLIRLIIQLMGGSITFESTEGKGTTFTISVPVESPTKLDGEVKLTPSE